VRVLVLGPRGLVGGAFVETLESRGHDVRVLNEAGYAVPLSRRGLPVKRRVDLRDASRFDLRGSHDAIVLAAARVGGIGRNVAEAPRMLLDNLQIQNSVIAGAITAQIPKLLFLGSSCIYPRAGRATVLEENQLRYGGFGLEPTNRPYALAKLAGIELLHAYAQQHAWFKPIVLMPPNLHGPPKRDQYAPARAHVLQALVARFAEAARDGADEVVVWGSGAPRREFLRVENVALAGVRLLERDALEHVVYNIGPGEDVSIRNLAHRIAARVGFDGQIRFDESRPEGVYHKTMDSTRLRSELGWQPLQPMLAEIDQTIDEYLAFRGVTT